MKNKVTISLDAMGGDNAPLIVIEGASIIKRHKRNAHFIMFGDENIINEILKKHKNLANCTTVVHTDKYILPTEKASNAVRRGRDSSMALAISSVKNGDANCAVSAGSTGPLMALALFILRPLSGVRRPAICTTMPTKIGTCCMLDLGANLEASAEDLVQYGIMGSVYSKIFNKGKIPSVGLLNVGSEQGKGRPEISQAAEILSKIKTLKYYGFVEGNDIGAGTVDVIVTDGFTGNVALKSIEGTAGLIVSFVKRVFIKSVFGICALVIAVPPLLKIRKQFNPASYNGAIMLGLSGIVVKSHGSASAYGFSCAIRAAIDLVERDFTKKLKNDLQIKI